MKTIVRLVFLLLMVNTIRGQDLPPISLPQPIMDGGKPLLQCLKERRTTREFSAEQVKPQILSNLLWAADGINRDDGHRTAPSAMNNQETEVYVFLAQGVYRYDATAHAMIPVLAGDHRAEAGKQEFVKDAPVNLVYVADRSQMGNMSDGDKDLYAAVDVGFIAENVYLYCAAEGLSCVARGSIDRESLTQMLKLSSDHKVLLAQSVGYPWK